jgi:hypothetical protein
MPNNQKPNASLWGTRLNVAAGAGRFLSKGYRATIIAAVNALFNVRVLVKTADTSGVNGGKFADVQITERGMLVTLPAVAGGGGSALELTDGTTDLTGVSKITVSGMTVGGTSAAATLTVGAVAMNFKGLWNSGSTYGNGDVVVIQTGVSAGTYISTIAGNTNNPSTGTGWMQIAPGPIVGNWV